SGFSDVHVIKTTTDITNDLTGAPVTPMCYDSGDFATLSITAIGEDLSYQWYKNTTATTNGATLINGATSNSYTPNSIENGNYYYYCEVTGECGTENSGFSGVHTIKSTTVIGIISAPAAFCVGAIYNPDAPTVTPNDNDIIIQRWQIETSAGSGIYEPLTLPHVIALTDNGKTIRYYATNSCGESHSNAVELTVNNCSTAIGTVFPFVHTGSEQFDNQFETTVKLYHLPPTIVIDKIGYIRKQTPVKTEKVTYYDCKVDAPIVGAPKDPGSIGNINNPGLPIRWNQSGGNQIVRDTTTLTVTDNCPVVPIGKFILQNVDFGDYVMEISRPGFLTRYGVISINENAYLGHRELLAGDCDGDLIINGQDYSEIRSKTSSYGHITYNRKYDLNGDGNVDNTDINILRFNMGVFFTIYQETTDWINP
ncbi:MAG: hypothetical protein FWF09_07260, partial [Bacteroidales bacterium]|nr:hypothetical protein [Bacteroidales bacterium]